MMSVLAYIPVEEEDRDPNTGYSPPPGVSWSWCWMFAHLDPQTQTYSNHQFDHDYGIKEVGGMYMFDPVHYAYEEHPYCWTRMWYRDNSSEDWDLDTFAQVNW